MTTKKAWFGLASVACFGPNDRVNRHQVTTEADPRIASAGIMGGPADLVGDTLVVVDEVRLNGETVHIPRPLPGVPEYVSVARAEARANALLECLVTTLVDEGPAKWQRDTKLVVEMRAAAEAAVTGATVGLEAFASHHVWRVASQQGTGQQGTIEYRGEHLTLKEIGERALDDRYKLVLPELLDVRKPTGLPWWPTFRRVQALAALTRHAVHQPVKRNGLAGEKPLAERFYTGEYRGAAEMMLDVFEHFSPGWLGDERRLALAHLVAGPDDAARV